MKIFSLPTKELLLKVQKINRRRSFKIPNGKQYKYNDIVFFDRFHCLKISEDTKKSQKAILFLYGGGMILSPHGSNIKFAARVGKQSKSDIWFPYYPLCMENSIDMLYKMLFEVYKRMVKEYDAENISFLGFSSGAALSIGLCQYIHEQNNSLPIPKQIIAYYESAFGYKDFNEIRLLMPWIVKFNFDEMKCVKIEYIDI